MANETKPDACWVLPTPALPFPLKEEANLGVSTYPVAPVTFQSDLFNIGRSKQASLAAI